jgi:signal transduction histidine kinase
MELKRSHTFAAGLLIGAWLLVVGWQVQEHLSVVAAAQSDLRSRSHEIAGTLSAVTRALSFRGAVFQERLDPVLKELVNNRANALVKLIYIGLLNTDGDPVVAAGDTNLFSREIPASGELWTDNCVTFILPVEGASVSPEGVTNNPTVVLPPFRDLTNGAARSRDYPRREPRPDATNAAGTNGLSAANLPPPPTNAAGQIEPPPPPPEAGDRPRGGSHRPPWMRGMTDTEFKALVAKHELHGLVLAMSTGNYRALCLRDLWQRGVIVFFAGISALGAGLGWRNLRRTADLQIRLVRASELNSHLKEMNLAAAGLAHETRNPLNLIRGQAQMIARLPDATPEVRDKSRIIVNETDKVTAQLTEFINYSRPREVRRTKIALTAACAEIVRTLAYDIGEKKLRVEVAGDPLSIEADEQLLRQVLFNLLINATQAVEDGGQIKVEVRRASATEAVLEVRDDGHGVADGNRQEIFKPYFTTHQKGTGLGLAVVSQIVLAHGWEIACLPNAPRGTIFRLTHLKLAA